MPTHLHKDNGTGAFTKSCHCVLSASLTVTATGITVAQEHTGTYLQLRQLLSLHMLLYLLAIIRANTPACQATSYKTNLTLNTL